MQKIKIKASNIYHLSDARYFAAKEVEWLGLALDEQNAHSTSPAAAKTMKEWISGPKIIGEFGLQSPEYIREVVQTIGLDGAQLHHLTSSFDASALSDIFLIKNIVLDWKTSTHELELELMEFAPYVQAFQLSFSEDENSLDNLGAALRNHNQRLDWLKQVCKNYPILIHFPAKLASLVDFYKMYRPTGICLQGGEEEKIGYKSYDELEHIFEEMEDHG